MQCAHNIFLVGLMGAGKTTIGRLLARRLKLRFVDCDHEIEARTGVRIPVIFEIEGEQGFRSRERQMIAELTHQSGLVLATGGGAVLSAENRANLANHGLVVYLHVEPALLWQRLQRDKTRPLLQVADPLAKLEELHAQRDPFYREVADLVVEGGTSSSYQLAKQLAQQMQAGAGRDAA